MRIRHLSIKNFRGIREMEWSLPDNALFCLIGRGDSTKSTVLEALRRAFCPQWNLVFDDADFYQCTPENEIRIEVTVGDIPEEFRDLATYGDRLCGWNAESLCGQSEPGEGMEDALCVCLSVGRDLEPSWRAIGSRDDEGVAFKVTDRARAAVSLIGTVTDRHLTWSRGSLLSYLTGHETISSSLADAGRAAKDALEARRSDQLTRFDEVAGTAEQTARDLGVHVASKYKAQLDSETINVRIGGLALHDGEMPLRQLGLGSKRMLMTGLQKSNLHTPHITLFDEVEIGLEPHRIARLLHHLKQDATGQYFLTTHSPVVLRELAVNDIYIVHSNNGKTDIVAANKPSIAGSIQGKIRSGAEAFLAPKIIVCEGATEVGFLRGLDRRWIANSKSSFAYQGIALFDARGAKNIKETAKDLKELSYRVSVLADADAPTEFSDADAESLRGTGVTVTMWDEGLCIESRIFADVPWPGALAVFDAACAIHDNRDKLLDQIQSKYGAGFQRDPALWTDHLELRVALGKAAKASDWFKRQSWGEQLANATFTYLGDTAIQGTDLVRKIDAVRVWIDCA
jgi:hypothetical protein